MSNVANKLHRLMNPQTVEDYGLSVSRAELMSVPEYAEAITEVEASCDKASQMIMDCMQNAERTRAELVMRVLTRE